MITGQNVHSITLFAEFEKFVEENFPMLSFQHVALHNKLVVGKWSYLRSLLDLYDVREAMMHANLDNIVKSIRKKMISHPEYYQKWLFTKIL